MFRDSVLDVLPGGIAPFIYFIGLAEAAAVVLLLISVVKKEYLPTRDLKFFRLGIFVTLCTFLMLAFGLAVISNYPGAANLVLCNIFTLGIYLCTEKWNRIEY